MKIEFEDKSYIEFKKSNNSDTIVVTVQAKDFANPLKKITNTVELTKEQFKQLISDID